MLTNPKMLMFMLTLIVGSLISVSSTSWYGAWMGLEINLLSFIPLTSKTNNQRMTESALKYFLVQALASMILLSAIMMLLHHKSPMMNLSTLTMTTSLALKLGAAPLHFWLVEVMEGMNWMNCLLLMSWQKLAPLTLMSYVTINSNIMFLLIISSVTTGAVGGLNQTSLRKIMAFSSIAHMGWLLSAIMCDNTSWFLYLIIYTTLTAAITLLFQMTKIFFLSQIFSYKIHPTTKLAIFTTTLSLGGLPPFLGFLPKWIIITNMTQMLFIIPLMIMIVMALITLYYYMRIAYSAFTLTNTTQTWTKISHPKWQEGVSLAITSLTLTGLLVSPLILNLNY